MREGRGRRDDTSQLAEHGEVNQQVDGTLIEVSMLATTADSTCRAFRTMGERCRSTPRVLEVLNLIDRTERQTNLAARNATSEAARAGEVRSGFAAAASEVKQLATEVSDAPREVSEIVGAVRRHASAGDAQRAAASEVASRVSG